MRIQNIGVVAFCLAQGLLADNILASMEDPAVDTEKQNKLLKSAIKMLNDALLAIKEVESLSLSSETTRRVEILELIMSSLSTGMSYEELRDYLTKLKTDCEKIVNGGEIGIEGYDRLHDFFTEVSEFTTQEHQRLCPA